MLKRKKSFIKAVNVLRQLGRQSRVCHLLIAKDYTGQFMDITPFLLVHRIVILVPILKAQRLVLGLGSATHNVAEVTSEPRAT